MLLTLIKEVPASVAVILLRQPCSVYKLRNFEPDFDIPIDHEAASDRRHRAIVTIVMVANTVTKITALEAEAAASLFLSDHLPDRITAGDPQLDMRAGVWRVPVLLAYPVIGVVGEVGEIVISGQMEEILLHTPVDEMLAHARALCEQHADAIKAPVP